VPRGVLGWARCGLCGNSPAVRSCGSLSICERCYYAVGDHLACEGAPRRAARVSADVDEALIKRIKYRAYRQGYKASRSQRSS
jgi:hypothetical protein